MATWELYRDGDSTSRGFVVPELIDVKYIDSANPFGDRVICQLEDRKGLLFDLFEFGTRIELFVTPDGGSEIRKFVGFMVEKRENDQNGQDQLEIIAHTFDQFLRQNDVSKDQSGKLISDAVQDIVSDDTPISVGAANISVIDDFEIQRSLQDLRVEEALQVLSFSSGNEAFGVDDDKNFFFEPKESKNISRGISDTQWFNYDIPERGKEAINEVEVRFNNGDDAVVIDNAQQKLQLDNSLNLNDPATKRARINRPTIKSVRDAELEGRRFLKLKNVTLTGTVTTFQLYEAEPGDTIDIEITDRGIDSEFIITKIEYHWARDETTLTIVENRGFDSDLIVRLEEKTERIDLRDTDPGNVQNRVVSTDVGVSIQGLFNAPVSSDVIERVTNDGVDLIANGWAGDGTVTGPGIVFGTDGSQPSRTDSALGNQKRSVSANASVGQAGSTPTVTFESINSITESNVSELGIVDIFGNLILRVSINPAISFINDTVSMTLRIDNVDNPGNSIMTDAGLKIVADILANNNPALPNSFLVGTNDKPPEQSDDILTTTSTTSTSITRKQLQAFRGPFDFKNNIDIPDDSPLKILPFKGGGGITTNPVTYIKEAENVVNRSNTAVSESNVPGQLSNGEGVEIAGAEGDFVELNFSPNQDIPPGKLTLGAFVTYENFTGTVNFSFNGDIYTAESRTNETEENNVEGFAGNDAPGLNNTTLQEGSQHFFKVRMGSPPSGKYVVDAVFAYDIRDEFGITAPASGSSGNPSFSTGTDTYNEPELFPLSVGPEDYPISFPVEKSLRPLTEAELTQEWNDTNVGASVRITIGNAELKVDNPNLSNGRINETLAIPSSAADTTASVDINLSRSNDLSDDTIPATGDLAQEITFHELSGNPEAITRSDIGEITLQTTFSSGELSGTTFRESGQVAPPAALITRSIFADISPGNDTIIPTERVKFIPE
jgi:hypothetical protein